MLQLDETTDITSQAQLIVYIRFPDMMVQETFRSLFILSSCWRGLLNTTASSIFSKVDYYFSDHEVMWLKCEAVSTDGA